MDSVTARHLELYQQSTVVTELRAVTSQGQRPRCICPMSDEIAISHVVVGEEEERLVLAVLRSGHLAQGPMVERLELEFAAMCGVRHAIAVSSGTSHCSRRSRPSGSDRVTRS